MANANSPITGTITLNNGVITGTTASPVSSPVTGTIAVNNSVITGTYTTSPVTSNTTWVYQNGVLSWAGDKSYTCTVNYKDTVGVPLSGLNDIAITAGQWGAWQPYVAGNTFSLTPFTTFTIAIKPTVSGQKWQMYCTSTTGTNGTMVSLSTYGPAPVIGVWGVYNVPVSAFGITGGTIQSFAIQDASGLSHSVWYVDNVGFSSGATQPVSTAPTVTLTSSAASIASGGSTTLTWSSTNAVSVAASGGWSGTQALNGTLVVSPTTTTTYTLTATGATGTTPAVASTTVTVTSVSPGNPTVTLTANPMSVATGGSTTLTWTTTNPVTVTASGGWSGTKASGGTLAVSPTGASTTYTLTNTGATGTTPAVASVTVTTGTTTPPVTTGTGGYDGTIAIGSGANSNKFVNGAGQVIQLRGLNLSGMETTAVHQWTADCWGDDGGEPNWATYQTWKPNVARIPLNAASFLGLTTFNTTGSGSSLSWGSSIKCDPFGTYRATIIDAVTKLRSINCYIIFDLHWCAPKITLGGVSNYLSPLGQSSFSDTDTGLVFWQQFVPWLKTQFPSGINDIMFELFNEPFLSDVSGATYSAGSADLALLNGGTCNVLINNSQGGTNYTVTATWTLAGYQQVLTAIRGTGATNVCIINGNVWSQQLQNFKTWKPTDTLNPAQIAFGCHPYTNSTYPYSNGNVYPSIGNDSGGGTAQSTQWFTACMNDGYPVIFTEDGGKGGTSATATPAEPHMAFMQSYVDSLGISYVAWQWNDTQPYNTSSTENLATAFASDGKTIVPILGEGTQTYNWMVNHK